MKHSLNHYTLKQERGLSLVELMIAITVGLLLMGGVTQIFVSSGQTYATGDSLSRIQEAGRFSTDIISREIRLIDFEGCPDPQNVAANVVATVAPTTGPTFSQDTLRGFEAPTEGGAAWTAPLDLTTIEGAVVSGTDVFSVQRMSEISMPLSAAMGTPGAAIQVANNSAGIAAGDLMIVSDCSTIDIFRASAIAGGTPATITHTNALSKSYATDATVAKFESNTFFIRDSGRIGSSGNTIFSLARHDAAGNEVDLIDGVENMQVLYGELTGDLATGGTIQYVPADAVTSMQSVVTIRVGLLLQSIENAKDSRGADDFTLLGTDITSATDRQMRRAFVITANLRNRM